MGKLLITSLLLLFCGCAPTPTTSVEDGQYYARYVHPIMVDGVYCMLYIGHANANGGITCDWANERGYNELR